ncbi:hypothetical protein [Thiomicrorhabdus heinhorstiae]|uniref:Uncharacterized protein n=1 Tax=Thiomicrorhabdus heinhorstiae TaxID=2748010 RepID=A0ABS0BYG3_9GAMM|nr:hypothetical protein [Thiomicrorhabdus heinhorstiae]MBF6058819.1 hypothetical protein [Thiomicrorhabdus heinhorstiae]
MSKLSFSADFYTQIGVQQWRADRELFTRVEESGSISESEVQYLEASEQIESQVPSPVAGKQTEVFAAEESPLILIGPDLSAVWENEDDLAWQLWKNILAAFDWHDRNVMFYDSSHLVSEEAVFAVFDELLEMGVERVLSVDDNPLADQLSEGMELVTIPSLQDMLHDPYAKQQCYETLYKAFQEA